MLPSFDFSGDIAKLLLPLSLSGFLIVLLIKFVEKSCLNASDFFREKLNSETKKEKNISLETNG